MAAPKIVQAVFAALQDFYTWKLARSIFGHESYEQWVALALTALSPWQWFCSTRTFSNGLETTLTIVALYFWPWHWLADTDPEAERDSNGIKKVDDAQDSRLDELTKLRCCLLLAGLACVLRPTNMDTAIIVTDVREEGSRLACPSTKAETDDGGQFFSSIDTPRYTK